MLRSPDNQRDDGRDPNFHAGAGRANARDSGGSTLKPGNSSPLGSLPLRLRPSGDSSKPTSVPGSTTLGAMGTYSEAAERVKAEEVRAFRARLAERLDNRLRVTDDGTARAEPAPVARRMPPPVVVLALLASVASVVLAVLEWAGVL